MSFCPPTSPAVAFNYATWVTRYPEFKGVAEPLAQLYFNEATIYCANKLNPVRDTGTLSMLLNMLTAHIAWLNRPEKDGQPASPLVGRISDATEGSVNVSAQMELPPGSAQWFNQTKYGAAYWAATAIYRTMRYRPKTFGPASLAQVPWLYSNNG